MLNEIQIVKEIVEVNPNWYDWIAGVVVPLGSLIGVIVTVWIGNKNNKDNLEMQQEVFNQEINRSKNQIAIEGLNKALEIYANMLILGDKFKFNEDNQKKYNDAMRDVISYGSKETVLLAACMQEDSYKNGGVINQEYKWVTICFLALLISQIKYDVTHVVVPAFQILKIKLSDYDKMKEDLDKSFDYIYRQYNITRMFDSK